MAHSLAPQAVLVGFGQGALHQLLDEQALHFGAAQEAFHRIDGPVHNGALYLGRFLVELELPVEVTALPALLLQVGHHRLAKAINRNFIDPFSQALAPVGTVGVQVVAQNFALHRMAAVVTVADAIGAFDRRDRHGERDAKDRPWPSQVPNSGQQGQGPERQLCWSANN